MLVIRGLLWKRGSSYCFFQVTGRAKTLFCRYTILGTRNSVIYYFLPIINSCHTSIIYISTFYPYLFSVCYLLSVIIFHTIYYTRNKFLFCNFPFWQGSKKLPIFKGQRQYHRDNKREILGWPESLFGFFCNIL